MKQKAPDSPDSYRERWSFFTKVGPHLTPLNHRFKGVFLFIVMSSHTYILHSRSLNTFYVGACHDDLEITK
jgi:hypothetical protein